MENLLGKDLEIQTLPTFWLTRILISRVYILLLDFKFPDVQPGVGRAWAGPGPLYECLARPIAVIILTSFRSTGACPRRYMIKNDTGPNS